MMFDQDLYDVNLCEGAHLMSGQTSKCVDFLELKLTVVNIHRHISIRRSNRCCGSTNRCCGNRDDQYEKETNRQKAMNRS